MSGLPEPAMPVGFGYSYLDWMGAYGYALALLGALYHRERTGEGQWIDASQCESGLFLTGATILDWSANEREFRRYGNRSPYKPAAPHGGTFNANPVTMAAGLAGMRLLTPEAFAKLDELGAKLRGSLEACFKRAGVPGAVTGLGSLFRVHPTDRELIDYRSSRTTPEEEARLQRLIRGLRGLEDDGAGIDEKTVGPGDRRLGVIGMRERAALLGGTLDIESRRGHGTTVIARIPAPGDPARSPAR